MLLENNSYPDDVRVQLEATALSEAGFQVTVICPTGESRKRVETIDGVRAYRYPCPWEIGGFWGYMAEYAYSLAATSILSLWILWRHGFDVVHSHTPPDIYVLIGRFYQMLGKRYVHDTHDLSPELYVAQRGGQGNSTVSKVLLWFERWACRSADRVISTNETQRDVQIDRCGADPDKCHIVRNGPSERFLRDVVPNDFIRSKASFILGYVGVIGVQDGVDCLVRMLKHLRSDLGQDDFHAVVVGTGPALATIQRLASDLGVSDLLTFTGYLDGDDLLRTIAAFDICVTPDPSNPYNDSCTTIKTMEYMAMSKPTVAFDLPENRLSAGDAGVYASGNDEMQLAELTRDLMGDAQRRAQMGSIGRERIETTFAWNHQRENLVSLYSTLLRPAQRTKPEETVAVHQ